MTDQRTMVEVATLRAHPRNYNRHGAGQVADIGASLTRFGQRKPITTWRGMILTGHGVVEAARALGWVEVWAAACPDEWTEAEALAWLAADNELPRAADPDEDALAALVAELGDVDAELARLAAGGEERLRELLASVATPAGDDPGAQIDRAEELRVKWGVETGQLWALGEHRLICGDCTDAAVVARVMGGEKADTIITDPPYNVDKAIWDTDVLPMLGSAANTLPELLTQDGICFWFTATRYIPQVIAATSVLPYRWMFIWYPSNNMAHGDLGFQKFTAALVLGRGKVWRENMQDLRDFPIRITKDDPGHPTPKPLELIEYLASMASRELVFDGFLGSGTTLIACERLGRRCRAVEISPGYVAVALERWSVMTGGTPVLMPSTNCTTNTRMPEADGDGG